MLHTNLLVLTDLLIYYYHANHPRIRQLCFAVTGFHFAASKMSSRSGRHTRSRSRSRSRSSGRSRDSRRSSRREDERPWLKRSQSRSVSPRSRSRSRSRSPRRRLRRSRTRSPPPRPVMSKDPKFLNSRVFVANLASDKTSNAELLALFEKHGKVLGKYE